jgi:hypothetical protein
VCVEAKSVRPSVRPTLFPPKRRVVEKKFKRQRILPLKIEIVDQFLFQNLRTGVIYSIIQRISLKPNDEKLKKKFPLGGKTQANTSACFFSIFQVYA